MIRFLSRRRSKTPATAGGVTPPPVTFTYLRPDGTSQFRRPDGTSTYIRP